jgi:hypothetical protein
MRARKSDCLRLPADPAGVLAFSYYIYYRVAQPGEASAVVRKLQSAIRERYGIEGRLLKKRDEPTLWMEIYEGVEDGAAFEAGLADLAEDLDFSGLLTAGSARKTECFEER